MLGAEEGEIVGAGAEVEGDLESQVREGVTEVAASKEAHATKAHAKKARRLAVDVEDESVPVAADGGGGGGAAQARKKRRAPVTVSAERAPVGEVGASSRAFTGGEVKRTRRDRNALDAHGGRVPARTVDADFVEGSGEGGSMVEPMNPAPPLLASGEGQVSRELVVQVASVFADFRDCADACFRRLMDILGPNQE